MSWDQNDNLGYTRDLNQQNELENNDDEEINKNTFKIDENNIIEEKSDTTGTKKKKKKKKEQRFVSRLSNAVNKNNQDNFEEDYDNYNNDNWKPNSEDPFEEVPMTLIKINLLIGQIVKSIEVLMNNSCQMDVVIQRAINDFNDSFDQEKVPFKWDEDPMNFAMKPAKKTGHPKVDMPIFNEKITIGAAFTTNFALCWKDDPDNFEKMFVKVKERKLCKKDCVIY